MTRNLIHCRKRIEAKTVWPLTTWDLDINDGENPRQTKMAPQKNIR